ncbi:MAG: L-threonylcarbamoyladenylate synthase [Flavisolibacter sp.]
MTEKSFFDQEVEQALAVLQRGGVILYPTDTIWGLGCDARNETAVKRIYEIKQRADSKSLIILLADEREILRYVAAPDPAVFDYIETQARPTTIIFEQAIGLPRTLIASDGSIAIRIVQDVFCRHLIKRLRSPLVSTSANISGEASPLSFKNISASILASVDHVVSWRQDDTDPATPSRIVKWKSGGKTDIIRE